MAYVLWRIMCRLIFCIMTFFLILNTFAYAHHNSNGSINSSDISIDTDKIYTVGVWLEPPFAFKDNDDNYRGLAIDLWEKVANSLNINYRYETMYLDKLLSSLATKDVDFGVGAITIDAARLQKMDFSVPFYTSGLGIVINDTGNIAWRDLFRTFFDKHIVRIMWFFFITLLISSVLFWLIERKVNDGDFHKSIRGIGDGLWFSVTTMTTVGYGDRVARTIPGRLLAILWMFMGVCIFSILTGSIASTLTTARLSVLVDGPAALVNQNVATIKGSLAEEYLEQNYIKTFTSETLAAAFTALENNKVDVVVFDKPLLAYYIKDHDLRDVKQVPGSFYPHYLGIAMVTGSPLRLKINEQVLHELHDKDWKNTVYLYLGDQAHWF